MQKTQHMKVIKVDLHILAAVLESLAGSHCGMWRLNWTALSCNAALVAAVWLIYGGPQPYLTHYQRSFAYRRSFRTGGELIALTVTTDGRTSSS